MEERIITPEIVAGFKNYLIKEEKSDNTIQKYMHDISVFHDYCKENKVTKELVIEYKQKLISDGYAVRSINSMIAAINSFFDYLGWYDCKVKSIKIQQEIFRSEEKELTKEEYIKLVRTAQKQGNDRLAHIIQTICATGIRVSELKFITVEAVKRGQATVSCKSKTRTVFIDSKICKILIKYAKHQEIKTGTIFLTKKGKPVNRTNIWRDMKKLCKDADVSPDKVFPHNLRHLFARVFYSMEKDIVKLADILGHSSINTTRIYIISTGIEHKRRIERMRLVL